MHAIAVDSFDAETVFKELPLKGQMRFSERAALAAELVKAWDGACPYADDDARTIQKIRKDIKDGINEDARWMELGVGHAYFAGDQRAIRCEVDVRETLANAEQTTVAFESLYVSQVYAHLWDVIANNDLLETERTLQNRYVRETAQPDQDALASKTPTERRDILKDVAARFWREAALLQYLFSVADIPG